MCSRSSQQVPVVLLRVEAFTGQLKSRVDEEQMGRPIISLLSMAYKNSSQGSPITVKLQQTGQKAIITVSYSQFISRIGDAVLRVT